MVVFNIKMVVLRMQDGVTDSILSQRDLNALKNGKSGAILNIPFIWSLWDNFRVCEKWKRPVLLDDNQKIEFTYYPPFYVHMGVVFSAEYLNLGPRQEL